LRPIIHIMLPGALIHKGGCAAIYEAAGVSASKIGVEALDGMITVKLSRGKGFSTKANGLECYSFR
jgi:hypothetical protein